MKHNSIWVISFWREGEESIEDKNSSAGGKYHNTVSNIIQAFKSAIFTDILNEVNIEFWLDHSYADNQNLNCINNSDNIFIEKHKLKTMRTILRTILKWLP